MKKNLILLALFTCLAFNTNAQTITASDVYIKISGNAQRMGLLNIDLQDAEDCTAVAFQVSLPSSIGVRDIGMPIGMVHSLYNYGDKYMFLSDDNVAFQSNVDLMDLSMTANLDASGIYVGRITGVELVTKDFQLVTLPDVSFTVTVDNDTDAINGMSSDSLGDEQIYSVHGIRQNTLQQGVNIVRRADGSTIKLLK